MKNIDVYTMPREGDRRLYWEQEASLATIIKSRSAQFSHFRDSIFYYNVVLNSQDYLQFQVPLEFVKANVTVHTVEKAIMFMKWIKKAREDGTLIFMTKPTSVSFEE